MAERKACDAPALRSAAGQRPSARVSPGARTIPGQNRPLIVCLIDGFTVDACAAAGVCLWRSRRGRGTAVVREWRLLHNHTSRYRASDPGWRCLHDLMVLIRN
jgi:hypothetical protein